MSTTASPLYLKLTHAKANKPVLVNWANVNFVYKSDPDPANIKFETHLTMNGSGDKVLTVKESLDDMETLLMKGTKND